MGRAQPGQVIADSRERLEPFVSECDGRRLLTYGDKNESFDFLLLRSQPPKALSVERKAWADFASSWTAKKLPRQFGAVDLVIVELPSLAEKARWSKKEREFHGRARKHLVRWCLNKPVVISDSPRHTMDILRYLADADSLELRESARKAPSFDFLGEVVSALGLNPERATEAGRTLYEDIQKYIDIPMLQAAINVDGLLEIPGVGPKAVERAKARLGIRG